MNKQFLSLIVVFCLGIPLASQAASTTVTVGSPVDRFTPSSVSINTGDQVIWNWVASNHSTTSGTNGVHADDNGVPSGLWDSGLNNAGHTFTNAFPVAGNFSYYCSQHFSLHMTGMVFVASSLVPLVSITSPASNSVFAAPANVTIQATASESGGSIASVRFLVGSSVVTNETTAPYAATTNLAAGGYTLTAIATDGGGSTATSSVPISVVTPVVAMLSNAARLSPANFQFSYGVNTGLSYVVQLSTNLTANWISLVTNVAVSNPVVFLDTHATNNPAFYRVGRMPNP